MKSNRILIDFEIENFSFNIGGKLLTPLQNSSYNNNKNYNFYYLAVTG